jgi:hypothetical protein
MSSSKKEEPYLLSHLLHIRIFEREDHTFCSSLKLDFDRTNNDRSSLYWRCRLSLAKFRLYTDTSNPDLAKHNLEINDLITKISLRLAETPEAVLSRENKKMDERDHKRCLAMGFTDQTEDQAKIDDYYFCRKSLIADQRLIPPFKNRKYLDYPNDSYNMSFVIDQRLDAEIKKYKEMKETYPMCMKYNMRGENFKNCRAAQEKSRQCTSQIEKKRFKRDGEEKITCQKQAYVRFPNQLIRDYDVREKEIERVSTNSAFYNQQSFASIGINDLSKFDSDEERAKKEKQKKEVGDFNTKNRMYSRFELTRLRQKYIGLCQKEADKKVKEYVDELRDECDGLAKFEIIGEE